MLTGLNCYSQMMYLYCDMQTNFVRRKLKLPLTNVLIDSVGSISWLLEIKTALYRRLEQIR